MHVCRREYGVLRGWKRYARERGERHEGRERERSTCGLGPRIAEITARVWSFAQMSSNINSGERGAR